ncbi:hypothetical protein AH865_22225 [Salmonella enterica subsp. enterica serovar Infantis]|nr:hypothetical protein [Salmonella enterica subsp. enterica serovar Infantis]ECO1013659.1 hypothetical protein [Salmonella enterica subsp. enterica serovar Newport]EGI5078544.1 hypothetical protein [Salmonella enterica subsp. enterica serovar Infantis]
MKEIVTHTVDNISRESCGITISPCKYSVAQTGYLVSAAEFEFVSLWRFYCLHCNRPVKLVMAQGLQPAHFIHVAGDLSDIAGTCPFVLKV